MRKSRHRCLNLQPEGGAGGPTQPPPTPCEKTTLSKFGAEIKYVAPKFKYLAPKLKYVASNIWTQNIYHTPWCPPRAYNFSTNFADEKPRPGLVWPPAAGPPHNQRIIPPALNSCPSSKKPGTKSLTRHLQNRAYSCHDHTPHAQTAIPRRCRCVRCTELCLFTIHLAL